MIDFFNLTDSSINNQIFYCTSSGYTGWQVWSKPKNATFVYFTVIGGGGGGGSGRGSGINSAAGGGGGGSSALTTGFFPANLLPDKLYISVGRGGAGGASSGGGTSNNGGVGDISYVSVAPNEIEILLRSGNAPSGGGFGGTGSVGGAGGTASSVWSTDSVFTRLGYVTSVAGQNGATGGQLSVGNNITASLPVTGGASGAYVTAAGTSYSGGSIVFGGSIPTLLGSSNSSGNAPDASGGFSFGIPNYNSSTEHIFLSSGGAGGGSSSSSPSSASGGDGGNASFGSGGGGGGGAFNGNGGAGGRGGNGIVIINCI